MANNYWLRSPNLGNTSSFWYVNPYGSLSYTTASYVFGLVPGFSVVAVTFGRKQKSEWRRRA